MVVENKPAAGGTVATAEVARAAPDGYTMLLGFNGPLAISPLLQKLPYDVQKDLAPVITTSSQPNVLAVNAAAAGEVRRRARRVRQGQPGQAQLRVGRQRQLVAPQRWSCCKSMAGIDAVHVPFNGSPPAVLVDRAGRDADDLRGDAAAAAADPGGQAARDRGDDGEALPAAARPADDRRDRLSDGFVALAWNGVRRPRRHAEGHHREAQRRDQRDPEDAGRRAEDEGAGFDLVGGTPEEFGALIKGEVDRWAPVIKKVGVKVD